MPQDHENPEDREMVRIVNTTPSAFVHPEGIEFHASHIIGVGGTGGFLGN